jgi:glycosyltransferase involved in cell wall biosynthesis
MDLATTGGISFREELQRMARDTGVEKFVRFCGFSENLVNDLAGTRVILLPSDSEGTPNCILEAMSSERLVVVSDAGELPFIVNNGEAGILHKRGDLEDLVRALNRLLDSNASDIDRLRKSGYERWQALFSLDAVMRQVEPYYMEQ